MFFFGEGEVVAHIEVGAPVGPAGDEATAEGITDMDLQIAGSWCEGSWRSNWLFRAGGNGNSAVAKRAGQTARD